MSMRTSADTRYGLFVRLPDVTAYCEKESCEPWELEERDHICYIGESLGADSIVVTKEGLDSYEVITDVSFLIMELRKFPQLFETAYSSYEKAIEELKELYAEYLPENFDFEGNFRAISYATFG